MRWGEAYGICADEETGREGPRREGRRGSEAAWIMLIEGVRERCAAWRPCSIRSWLEIGRQPGWAGHGGERPTRAAC